MDAADLQHEIKFALGEIVHRLIGGDAIFVETTALGPGLEDRHLMAMHGKAMCSRNARRASADNGNVPARFGCAGKRVVARGHQHIGGVALQMADLHRLAFRHLAHTDLLAERFGRADAGAHAAQNVFGKNGPGRASRVACIDLPDEKRNIDARRAGVHARRVITEITAVAFDNGFMR
ncbi:Uncharacterised protein [Brucella melitensis]|nr:Uncharacterised protein [Brucella melitensis]